MKADLTTLRTVLATAVVDSDCEVSQVTIAAGRPAAPSDVGAECQTRIYVFGQQFADLNQNDPNACEVRSRLSMQYEIWTCYPEDWYDQISTEEAAAAADCLSELMSLAWCALVEARDGDTFGDYCWVELAPLEVQPRNGGAVSALGGVTISYDCTPSSP